MITQGATVNDLNDAWTAMVCSVTGLPPAPQPRCWSAVWRTQRRLRPALIGAAVEIIDGFLTGGVEGGAEFLEGTADRARSGVRSMWSTMFGEV